MRVWTLYSQFKIPALQEAYLKGLEGRSTADKGNVCANMCRLGKRFWMTDPAPSEMVPEMLQHRVKVLRSRSRYSEVAPTGYPESNLETATKPRH